MDVMSQEYRDWLESLKVGDKVVIWSNWGNQPNILDISRETNTLFFSGSLAFSKETGKIRYTQKHVNPLTEDVLTALETFNLCDFIRRSRLELLTIETLRKIKHLIEDEVKK